MLSLFLLCTLSMPLTRAKPVITLPANITALLLEKSAECAAEIGADADTVQRVIDWQYDDNETTKEFTFCLFRKIGLGEETGHFKKGKILALFEKSDKIDMVRDAFNYCRELNEKTPMETMYKGILCFAEKSPVLLHI